jgi:hypothetical protein
MKQLCFLLLLIAAMPVFGQTQRVISPEAEARERLDPHGAGYDPQKAFELYQASATSGNARSMNALGVLYAEGLGTAQNAQTAISWFEKAARGGYPDAWHNLAVLYKDGKGVKQDFVKAFNYYKTGTEHQSSNCYYGLGYCYYKGLGCRQSYQEAAGLFKFAVKRGSTSSMYLLGLCYRNGYGVQANADSARYWIGRAAGAGYAPAKQEMREPAPENPDAFKTAPQKRRAASVVSAASPDRARILRRTGADVTGSFTGYVIKYDWSGQHVIGRSRLRLELRKADTLLTGTWIQDDTLSTSFTAALTDSSVVFRNTALRYADRYSRGKSAPFEFRDADLQLVTEADTVHLSGNIRLWSTADNEPERPILVNLTKDPEQRVMATGEPAPADSVIRQLKVYPNPFEQNVKAEFDLASEQSVEFILVDVLSGRILYRSGSQRYLPGVYTKELFLQLRPGTYVLRLSYGKGVKSSVIIKK